MKVNKEKNSILRLMCYGLLCHKLYKNIFLVSALDTGVSILDLLIIAGSSSVTQLNPM